ncbi:MAG: tetratricopeptide repeat protein [Planctomycetaceae bacterium]|nr:tetratricopeptide repeat protein [Planctomycetaceae bacterium]
MDRGRKWLFAWCLISAAALPAWSADEPAASPEQPAVEGPSEGAIPGLQPGDDVLEPFEPRDAAAPDAEARRAARAWYMTGKVHEARSDNNDELELALNAYRHAVELDPTSLKTYESLIPALYAHDEKDEARRFALQAAQRTERGLRLTRGLAAVMARGDSVADAVGMLREAVALPNFDPASISGLLVHRDLGMYLHLAEQPGEAAKSYQLVFDALLTEREPPLTDAERTELLGDAGATYDELGKTFLEAKLPDLAVKAFDEAAKFRTGRPGIHSFNLALVFRDTGKVDESLAELEKYFDAQLQSKGRDAYQLLKDLLAGVGRSEELVPKLETLHAADPRNAFLAYFLADEYVARGDVDRGQELYEQTLDASTDPRGLVGLMPVYRKQQKPKELLDILGKIYPQIPEERSPEDLQKLAPDARAVVMRYEEEFSALAKDSAALDGLMQVGREQTAASPPEIDLAEAYMLGKLAIAAERTDDAVNFYKLTMTMLNQPMLSVYRELGEYLIDQKKYGDAADVFREASEHPAFEQARWILLYFMTYPLEFDGKTEEALKAIAEARGSQPDNPQLHFQQAWIYYHAERWDEAEPLLKEIIDEYKGEAENESIVRNSQFSLSNLYVQKGDVEHGEQVLQDVLKEAPDNSQANNDLGYLWADRNKNLEEARGMIEKALKAEPENPAYLDSMGWVLYRLGQFAEARTHLDQAVALPTGQDSTIFEHLGDVLDKLDLKTEAVTAWRKAEELERAKAKPDDEVLQRLTAKLPAEAQSGDESAATP